MFVIQQNQTNVQYRTVVIYLLDDATGTTGQAGVSPTQGDITIRDANGTVWTESITPGSWNEIPGGPEGVYTYAIPPQALTAPGPATITFSQVGIRTFTKEFLVTAAVVKATGNTPYVLQNQSHQLADTSAAARRVVVYLHDAATDLVPYTSATLDNVKVAWWGTQFMSPGIESELTSLSDGLYAYTAQGSELATDGYFILSVEGGTMRTFVKDLQIAEPEEGPTDPDAPDETVYRIPIVDESLIRSAYAREQLVGRPKYACIRPKSLDRQVRVQANDFKKAGEQPQRYEIMFYPVPDQQYTLEYRYNRAWPKLPATRSTSFGTFQVLYPPGTHHLAELFLQSALAIAEARMGVVNGPERALYLQQLEAAKAQDGLSEFATAESIWPDDLVEISDHTSALATYAPGFNLNALKRDVGGALGFGFERRSWTHFQEMTVMRFIQQGYRRFVIPPILPDIAPTSHVWSFLSPVYSITINAAQTEYTQNVNLGVSASQLPANFGGVIGKLASIVDVETYGGGIEIIDEHRVRLFNQMYTNTTGRPIAITFLRVATEDSTSNTIDQRWKMQVWPTPDAEYTVQFKYMADALPLRSGGSNIVPFGAPLHSETILASCLAVVEEHKLGKRGAHYNTFIDCLRASITYDLKASVAPYFGYNRDRSDDWMATQRRFSRISGDVTYNA